MAVVDGVTTVYVGNHYIIPLWDEVKNGAVTKYYFAGTTRLAVRTNGTLSYLLGDHLGSSSVTTDANGTKTASALYREESRRDKAFGETRYTLGNLGTDYKFTGQREEASLGIYFFNARWYDGSLGRFLSPDTIVPTQTQGTQAWDRYAFVNNNPVRYNDPTGHMVCPEGQIASGGKCINAGDGSDYGYGEPQTQPCPSGYVMSNGNCVPQPQDPSPQPNSCPIWDQNCLDNDATKEPELTSPNPPLWELAVLDILIIGATFVLEIPATIMELFPPPIDLIGVAITVTLVDFEVAFSAYVVRVAMQPDVEQHIDISPLTVWGFFPK